MAKPRVYVTRIIPEQGLKIVREHCDMRIWEGDMPPPREIILKEITGCDGILSMLTDRMDGPVMDVAPRLRVISNCAVGYDNIDVPAATARKIVVGHTPGVLTETVADFAFALLLAAARRVVEGDKYTRAGKWKTWEPMGLLGQDVHRATLGLVGLGRIGAAVAKRAQGFEMKVLYHDVVRREDLERSMGIQFTTLDTLLRESDFVSIHVPLLPETHHLIGAKELDKMKRSAVLVNTARGPIVDLEALTVALREGQFWAAGLDVFDPEPFPADHPLLKLDNVIAVPHIASASYATRAKMAMIAAENLVAVLQGRKPPHAVNPEVLSAG